MPDAILHTATRVIRRLTTEPTHSVTAEESKQVVPGDFDLAGGPWVLNVNGSRRPATVAEQAEAFSTPARQVILDLRDALQSIEGEAQLPAKVRAFATRLLALYPARVPIE